MKTEIALMSIFAVAVNPANAGTAQHHAIVVSHGAQIMPFNQTTAMHMFVPSASGGELEVMVHDMDKKQIALVRAHLRSEAAKFAVGDYSDPAYIHGRAMPGLRGMESNIIGVRYSDAPMGGRITFITTTSGATKAVHDWLAAQAVDHNTARPHCTMKT